MSDLELDRIVCGDCVEVMRSFPDGCVHTCVTSPPYFGLRDYGVDGQIGLEGTPDEYVSRMVEVFREVRRVLRDDGTLWLNLGDSYGATGGDTHTGFNQRWSGTGGEGSKQDECLKGVLNRKINSGLRPKNLLGIPWRVAFALQSDGWYLRQDIIWSKPNPMPESVRDRCTKSHEYIFLLSKSQKYYYDYESIQEPAACAGQGRGGSKRRYEQNEAGMDNKQYDKRNKRSVWTVQPCSYEGAHFATFPPALIEPCILAGCPEEGVVFDPFMGSGTTAYVARSLGRRYLGSELNPEYIKLCNERLSQLMLFS